MARRSSFDERTRPRRTKPSTASSSDAPPRPSATITIAQFVLGVPSCCAKALKLAASTPTRATRTPSGTSVRLMARMMRPGSGRRENCQAEASTKAM